MFWSGLLKLLSTKAMSKIKNYLSCLIAILAAALSVYFWWDAYRWENLLLEEWAVDAKLSNLSASLEYSKALVKMVATGIVATSLIFCLKGSKK